MVDLFCSWYKGLAYSKEALGLVKDSNLFKGLELWNVGEEMDLIKNSGLGVSVHNPLRVYGKGLEGFDLENLVKDNPLFVNACEKSSTSFVGFHAGYSARLSKNSNSDDILAKCKSNISFLKSIIGKQIIFENCSLSDTFFESGNEFALNYCTSNDFFRALLAEENVGFLLDVSHAISSASTKINKGLCTTSIEDYFSDILTNFSEKIVQLHLSSTMMIDENTFVDAHLPIDINDEAGRLALCLAKEAVLACPNLKAITLEIDTRLPPIDHVKTLIKQAELVNKIVL